MPADYAGPLASRTQSVFVRIPPCRARYQELRVASGNRRGLWAFPDEGCSITFAHEPEQYSGNWLWDGTRPFFTGFLGYRFQRRGELFRIGAIPLNWTNKRLPWFAISMGFSI